MFKAFENPAKRILLMAGANQIGKGQLEDETVLTPRGFVKIKNIEIGDKIFSKDGTVCNVVGVFPQGEQECYEVFFNDKSSLRVDDSHLWDVLTPASRFNKRTRQGNESKNYRKYRTLSTKEIIKLGGLNPNPTRRCSIPLVEPIQFTKKNLLIDPYVMGLLLADAGISSNIVIYTKKDEELLQVMRSHSESMIYKSKYDYKVTGFLKNLQKYNLIGTKSHTKFIPSDYLYSNVEDRISILRGLMDSDGSIYGKCVMEYSTTSPYLRDGIIHLVNSLGGVARVKEVTGFYTKNNIKHQCKQCYRVFIRMRNLNPFKLKRKSDRFYQINVTNERIIHKIKPIGKHKTICIRVDHDSSLYVAKNFIVTHNTLAETCIAMAACRGHWPWEKYEEVGDHIWEARGWEPPIRIRWVGQGWEQHILKVLVEKGIEELWPSDWKITSKKNNLGVKHIFRDELTGSEIQLMSADQDVTKFEGWTGHLCLFDEPCNRDIWIACQRGLISNHGLAAMGATLLNQGWISQDIINKVDVNGKMDKTVTYLTADIRVNEGYGLDKEGIDIFESQLTEEEREARILGIPVFMSSLVLKMDRDKNIIPRIPKIPFNWIVDVAIDIGVAKPHDITFIATDEKGMKYVIFDDQVRGDGSDIGNYIIDKKNTYYLRINRVLTDPLAKSDQNNENTTWDKIDMVLNRHNLYLEGGSKKKSDGVILINSYLKTINNMPALFFFDDCFRAINQCLNWAYDKKTFEPSKKNDDQCENLYRLILLETAYEEPGENQGPMMTTNREDANQYTGY